MPLYASLVCMAGAAALLSAQAVSLNDVLRRAGAYAERYHRDFTSVVAEEHYVQRVTRADDSKRSLPASLPDDGASRTLRSDYMLLRGEPGETAWLSFRDIFEVDGTPVSGERGRLERWLRDSRASFSSRARALALDQARYNIGSIVRTINVPLLPLEFLSPGNQKRLRFRLSGRETIGDTPVFVVTFEERDRPTMIRTPEGDDVPATGVLWIEPASGRVLKTELRTGDRDRRQVRTTITVSYQPNERLSMLVPEAMDERYATGPETITGSARYFNYRRFETDVRIR
jgi:hypothetical protein